MRKQLLLIAAAAAALSSGPIPAKSSGIGPLCNPKMPVSKGRFYGVRADQYTAKPQPNLMVKGVYRSSTGPVSLKNVIPGGFVGSTKLLKLTVGKNPMFQPCQAFHGAFRARTAQFNKVQIHSPSGNITVPVHVWK